MKCDILINAIGCIDGAFIDEAENYKPKRRMPAWIWAASAACLCVAVLFTAWFTSGKGIIQNNTLDGVWVIAGEAVNGYVDYRGLAQTGGVLITDELKSALIRSEDYHKKYDYVHFNVRIIDANGADNNAVASALGLGFTQNGTFTLTEDEIYAIKGVPGMALIVTTEKIKITREYLNTVGRDSLDVEVTIKLDYDWLKKHYKGGDAAEYWEWRDNYVSGLVNEYADDYGIEFDREIWSGFCAKLDTELISRLLQDGRTGGVFVPSFKY